jgi:hypothetical protein
VPSQVDRRPPQGAELHKRSAEASDFDQYRAPRQNRAQREDALLAGLGEFERTITDEKRTSPAGPLAGTKAGTRKAILDEGLAQAGDPRLLR